MRSISVVRWWRWSHHYQPRPLNWQKSQKRSKLKKIRKKPNSRQRSVWIQLQGALLVLIFRFWKIKGVAQPYLFLWELFRELQLWDRSETFHGCRADLVGELPFFKFWKLSLVLELYPVYFRNSLIKMELIRTYCKCKTNQTRIFVSLCSGLKPPFFKKSNNNLEMEI